MQRGQERGTGSFVTGHTLLPWKVVEAGPLTQINSASLENLTFNLTSRNYFKGWEKWDMKKEFYAILYITKMQLFPDKICPRGKAHKLCLASGNISRYHFFLCQNKSFCHLSTTWRNTFWLEIDGFAILISQFAVCGSSCSSLQGCTCKVNGPSSACPLPAKKPPDPNCKSGPAYGLCFHWWRLKRRGWRVVIKVVPADSNALCKCTFMPCRCNNILRGQN